MKRILFYTGVALVALCLAGVFVLIFWFLISRMTATIAKSAFSVFSALFFMPLFVAMFLVLTIAMFSTIGVFIHRADLFYRMRTRAFRVLRSGPAGQWQEPALPSEPYFPGAMTGFSYFALKAQMPFGNYGEFAAITQGRPSTGRKRGLRRSNRGAETKRQFTLVERSGILQDEAPRGLAPGFSAGRGDNIRPFPRHPRHPRNRRKG
jgi:hypothetical protein